MLTLILIDLMNQGAKLTEIPFLLMAQIGYGTLVGIIIGMGTSIILKKIKFMVDGLETIFRPCHCYPLIFTFNPCWRKWIFSNVFNRNHYWKSFNF